MKVKTQKHTIMRRLITGIILASLITGAYSCGTARRAEAEARKKKEKLEQLEKDKKKFESLNRNELKP